MLSTVFVCTRSGQLTLNRNFLAEGLMLRSLFGQFWPNLSKCNGAIHFILALLYFENILYNIIQCKKISKKFVPIYFNK
jgi:hypothetical protein